MPVAYIVVPYTRERGRRPGSVLRRVAIDDLTPQIAVAGGQWREMEIDGDRAVVRIEAPDAMIALMRAQGWAQVTRAQAARLVSENPRRKPRRNPLVVDPAHPDSLIFDGPVQAARTLDQLDEFDAGAARAR